MLYLSDAVTFFNLWAHRREQSVTKTIDDALLDLIQHHAQKNTLKRTKRKIS